MPLATEEDLTVVPARPTANELVIGLHRLDAKIVQITTWAASAFALVLITIGLIGSDNQMLIMSINPSVIALVGWLMMARGNPMVAPQLLTGMVGTGLLVAFAEGHRSDDAIFGLFAMGVVGVIFARRHVPAFMVLTIGGLAAIAYVHEPHLETTLRVQIAFGAAGTYMFLAVVVLWLKKHWLRSQEALQQLIRSKDELVASVSHELRTPMTTVVGLSRELDERYDDFTRAEVEEFVSLLVQESTDVANILEDLLVAARADVGTLSLDMQYIDMSEQLHSVLTIVPAGSCELTSTSTPLHVVADEGRVRQILRNLVVNAHRYGGPSVRVVVQKVGDDAVVAVRDDGPAIPVEDRDRIFEPYEGLTGVSGIPGSVGLGLTVSRELARLMGGDLTYYHDGRDASFVFSIPLSEPSDVRSTDALEVTPVAM
ncbi:MAG: HAMP domain-containing histidine kinase [bacterium]|nr:HAMP domain-containing histidine kinase [bacterium]